MLTHSCTYVAVHDAKTGHLLRILEYLLLIFLLYFSYVQSVINFEQITIFKIESFVS